MATRANLGSSFKDIVTRKQSEIWLEGQGLSKLDETKLLQKINFWLCFFHYKQAEKKNVR